MYVRVVYEARVQPIVIQDCKGPQGSSVIGWRGGQIKWLGEG